MYLGPRSFANERFHLPGENALEYVYWPDVCGRAWMPERSKGADLRSAGRIVRVGSNPTSGIFCRVFGDRRGQGGGKKNSPTGTRTRVVWVKTTYPDQLDYWGDTGEMIRGWAARGGTVRLDGGKKKRCGVSGFRSQYLVLAKDARFQLRQYPATRLDVASSDARRDCTTGTRPEPLPT